MLNFKYEKTAQKVTWELKLSIPFIIAGVSLIARYFAG